MEDEIKINEYVRTNNKGIKRIDRIDNNKTVNKYLYFTGIEDFEGKEYGIIKTTEIVKHSKELKDLIESGDLIIYRLRGLKHQGKGFIRIYKDARSGKENLGINNYSLEQIEIIKILTHEQIEANCYKVGGLYGRNQ